MSSSIAVDSLPASAIEVTNDSERRILDSKGELIKELPRPLFVRSRISSLDGKSILYYVREAQGEGGSNYHSLIWCVSNQDESRCVEIWPSRSLKTGKRPMWISNLKGSISSDNVVNLELGVQSSAEINFKVKYVKIAISLNASTEELQKKAVEAVAANPN